eukprot:jgi/Botrbrau1/1067/Bobra.0076s0033.1
MRVLRKVFSTGHDASMWLLAQRVYHMAIRAEGSLQATLIIEGCCTRVWNKPKGGLVQRVHHRAHWPLVRGLSSFKPPWQCSLHQRIQYMYMRSLVRLRYFLGKSPYGLQAMFVPTRLCCGAPGVSSS